MKVLVYSEDQGGPLKFVPLYVGDPVELFKRFTKEKRLHYQEGVHIINISPAYMGIFEEVVSYDRDSGKITPEPEKEEQNAA